MAAAGAVHTLYRFFDASGALLYVGRTVDARSRWRTHERTKEWFVNVASVTREVLPSADELAAAELRAIAEEGPLHNIQHNQRLEVTTGSRHKPKLKSPAPDDLLITRWWALGGRTDAKVDPTPNCGDAYIENDCECAECHAGRMRYLEGIEEDYLGDDVVEAAARKLRADYAEGAWLVEWLYDLFDLPLFRRIELIQHSRKVPAPAFGTTVDHGIEVGCPFCHGVHEHFLTSGTPLGHTVLATPCGGGQYVPGTDYDTQSDRYYGWLDAHARQRAS